VLCGLEIAGEITVRISVLKDVTLPLPMLVEGEEIMTIASAETLDEAALMATKHMHTFLTNNLNMGVNEAGMLLSLAGDLRICQIVDPLKTARMEIPLWMLEKYQWQVKL
jgi:amidase